MYLFVVLLFLVVDEEEEPAIKVPKFTPFTGSGKRLDGKTQTKSTEPEDTKRQEEPTENGKDDEKLSVTTPRQRSGKLVFGSNSKTAAKETVKVCFLSELFHLCDLLWLSIEDNLSYRMFLLNVYRLIQRTSSKRVQQNLMKLSFKCSQGRNTHSMVKLCLHSLTNFWEQLGLEPKRQGPSG